MDVINEVQILSLRELEEQSDTSLFVVNNTQPRGEIIFNVTTGRGRDHTVIVPDTWIPFDLTTQAKKAEIVDSPDFRRAVSQKYLLVVSTKSADEFIEKSEHSQTELQRIFNKAGGQNNIAANSVGSTTKMQQIMQQSGGIAVAAEGTTGESISGAVIQIISRSNSEGDEKMDVKEAMSLLVGRSLNGKELDYIIKNSIHADIKAFASKKI
jgi:FAD synthase